MADDQDGKKAETRWASAELVALALDLGLPLVGIPPLASVAVQATKAILTVGQAVFERNVEEASAECARTLDATPGASDAVLALREDREAAQRRLTLAWRLVMEAGRHPDRAMRLALGRAAARMVLWDTDTTEGFEVSEVLARMTAVDLDGLNLLEAHDRLGVPNVRGLHEVISPARFATRLDQFQLVGSGKSGIGPSGLGHLVVKFTRDATTDPTSPT